MINISKRIVAAITIAALMLSLTSCNSINHSSGETMNDSLESANDTAESFFEYQNINVCYKENDEIIDPMVFNAKSKIDYDGDLSINKPSECVRLSEENLDGVWCDDMGFLFLIDSANNQIIDAYGGDYSILGIEEDGIRVISQTDRIRCTSDIYFEDWIIFPLTEELFIPMYLGTDGILRCGILEAYRADSAKGQQVSENLAMSLCGNWIYGERLTNTYFHTDGTCHVAWELGLHSGKYEYSDDMPWKVEACEIQLYDYNAYIRRVSKTFYKATVKKRMVIDYTTLRVMLNILIHSVLITLPC